MIRDLGQPVSAIDIDENSVIAGGWDGLVKKWNVDGDLLWSIECSDRIEAILRLDGKVIVTSGLHISCISEGDIQWTSALEGSADLLAFYDGKIIATSSVYDIEHGDFMESAVWHFSVAGELIKIDRLDERPWFMDSTLGLILGLGRPKCGFLINEKHRDLPTESPVTCGLKHGEKVLFGHADGTISSSQGEIVYKIAKSVESLISGDEGIIAATENGELVSVSGNSNESWKAQGQHVSTQASGFDGNHWCGSWGPSTGYVEVRKFSGELLVSTKTSRPRVSDSSQNRVGFGFDDGQIMIWEKTLFNRRLSEENSNQNERNLLLAAKLRSLRN